MAFMLSEKRLLKRAPKGCDGDAYAFDGMLVSPTVSDGRVITGVIASSCTDLDGEVIVPGGLDTSYFPKRVKSVYWNHDYDRVPVGTCAKLYYNDAGQLVSQTHIINTGFGDEILTAIREGAINGLSIGASVIEQGPPTHEESVKWKGCRNVIRKAKMLEYSVVPMPANPDALMGLVSKGLIRKATAEMMAGDAPTPTRKRIIMDGEQVWSVQVPVYNVAI